MSFFVLVLVMSVIFVKTIHHNKCMETIKCRISCLFIWMNFISIIFVTDAFLGKHYNNGLAFVTFNQTICSSAKINKSL